MAKKEFTKKYMIRMDFGSKIPLDYEIVSADIDLSIEIQRILKKPVRVVLKGSNFTVSVGNKDYTGRISTIYSDKKKLYVKKGEEYIEFNL